VASGSGDKTIKLWEVAAAPPQQTIEGHFNWIKALVISPNSELVASGSTDQTVKLWRTAEGTLQQTLKGHSDWVNVIAFSPDGNLVASGSDDHTVKLWHVDTGALHLTLNAFSMSYAKGVSSITFSPDGKLVASGDSNVMIWDVAEGIPQQTIWHLGNGTMAGFVSAVTFSPDGRRIASGIADANCEFSLWDATTGARQLTLDRSGAGITALAFSPDGKTVLSGSYDRTIKLWDAVTGALQHELKVDAIIIRLSFSKYKSYLETERGLVTVPSTSTNIAPLHLQPVRNIFVKDQWVARHMENFLWLPPDYRVACVVVQPNILVLCHTFGQITILKFS
jgi:WD40 repeat protein